MVSGSRYPSEEEALELALDAGLPPSSLVVVSEFRILSASDGDVSDEPYYALYRKTFNDPGHNPRWEIGYSEYCYIVDLGNGTLKRHDMPVPSDGKSFYTAQTGISPTGEGDA